MRRIGLAAGAALALAGCADTSDDPQAALVRQGKAVYQTDCIACHNPDPAQDGSVGPAVAGASLELLRAKVIHNEYPPGYTPKRDTKMMIALVHREPDLPALEAYLASVSE